VKRNIAKDRKVMKEIIAGKEIIFLRCLTALLIFVFLYLLSMLSCGFSNQKINKR